MSQDFDFSHEPVLLKQCIQMLAIKPDGIYVDCTAGGGGHSSAILEQLSAEGMLISLDQDDEALAACQRLKSEMKSQGQWLLIRSNFSDLDQVLETQGIVGVDGILADLGVSSHQLDTAGRGFSYASDGPLDMRMDESQLLTAKIVVNRYEEEKIVAILRNFGEERYAGRIAAAIVRERQIKEINSTLELARIIMKAMPAKAKNEDQHPCRRSFQAIRIEVNHELAVIEKLLDQAPKLLNPGGRLAVISFHSLEDRLIKEAFKTLENPCTCPREFPVCICNKKPLGKNLTKKPIIATKEEASTNKRSRSAKLRVFERSQAE